MQIGIVKDGINRTFRNCVLNHMWSSSCG